jgi:putative ABC transport system permease protein
MQDDVKFAIRSLRKARGLTATVLITLSLCIGANTAIFSMVYQLAIKPPPFPAPDRLVEVYNSFPKDGINDAPSDVPQYLDFREHAPAFAHMALWTFGEWTLNDGRNPVRIQGASATADMFEVLGLKPVIGRFFTAENQLPETGRVAVLTQSCWESRFHSDPGVVGKTLRLYGADYQILGVAPAAIEYFDKRMQIITPIVWTPSMALSRYGVGTTLYGRLKPGATVAEAHDQLAALERRYYDGASPGEREFLDRSGHIIGVAAFQEQRVVHIKASLYLLEGGVLFVLLIGCVNVANLLLARSNSRQAEFAIRVALGAGRWAIAQQLLTESILLASLGALLGLSIAWLILTSANHFAAHLMPAVAAFVIDVRTLGYTAGVAAVVALAIGMLPVAHVLGGNLRQTMQLQSRGASSGRGMRATSGSLVVAQTALALILLVGAGLLVRSFANVLAVDPGFDPRHVISARIALQGIKRLEDLPKTLQEHQLFLKRLEAALDEVPGFTAALATSTPIQTGLPLNTFALANYTLAKGAAQPSAFHLGASTSYLKTLHVPLLQGRWFNDSDTEDGRKVYVVDEAFAERYYPDGSAVGQHIVLGAPPEKMQDWPEIVGVVGNVRHNGMEESSGHPYIYHPLTQTDVFWFSVLIRTERPLPEALSLLRAKVASLDPSLPVFLTESMQDVIRDSFEYRRSIMVLLGCFAALALLLSALGIYGVLAYDVSQRTREIGVRSAIGATSYQITVMILRQGLWKALLGLSIGLAGALSLSRFMSDLLYGMKPTDPWVYAAVVTLLLAVALLAGYLPARRATTFDPVEALRAD